ALRRAEQLEHLVRGLDPLAHAAPRPGKVAEVTPTPAAAAVFVLVGRADAPARGADLVTPLARPVEQLVIGQREMRAVGDVQALLGADAARAQSVELGEERLGIEHHAVADDAHGALDDARG